MKLTKSILAGILSLSLVACGGSSKGGDAKTGTGKATGYGGDVTVTITVQDSKITKCEIVGDGETENVGKAALPDLEKQVVEANGAEIEGVSGASVTSEAVKEATKAAMAEAGL